MNRLPILHRDQAEFKALMQEASNEYNIGEAMIEKDYWVTWCINYLFGHSPWRDRLGFKGGTCMAKAYDVISRFSEDVDILLDWRLLGYRAKEPMEPTSNRKRDLMKKDMNERTVMYLAEDMLPVMQRDVLEMLGPEFRVYIAENDPMSIQFEYPKVFSPDPNILSTVKLEIGPMSQWSQLTPQPITSMIDKAIPGVNIFTPIPVLSVSPERTFWDKVSILQNVSHWRDKNPTREIKDRYSRHYYDVYRILNSPYRDACLANTDLFFEAMDFSARFYPVTTFDYKEIDFSNLQLEIPQSLLPALKLDYERMKGMLFGDKPSFDTIYQSILAFKEELRATVQHDKGSQTHTVPLDSRIADASQRSVSKAVPFPKAPSMTDKDLDL